MWVLLHVSALIVFVVSLAMQYYYSCILAIYDVRSSHIVSIRTGLKSRPIWDWSAVIHTISTSSSSSVRKRVKWEETSYDTCCRTSVQYTMRRRMIRVGAITYGLWLAQNSPKTFESYTKETKPGVPGFVKPKTGTMWRWPIAGLLACDLHVVLECTVFWHKSDQKNLFLAKIIFVFLLFHPFFDFDWDIVCFILSFSCGYYVVVVVVVTSTHRYNAVRGHRTGSTNSRAEN